MTAFHEDYPLASHRTALAPPFSVYVENVVLAADMIARIAVPAGSRFALFSFDGDLRVKIGTATTDFALPSASTSNGSGSVLNPAARRIPAKLSDGVTNPTHLVLRAPAACKGSIEFYE